MKKLIRLTRALGIRIRSCRGGWTRIRACGRVRSRRGARTRPRGGRSRSPGRNHNHGGPRCRGGRRGSRKC